jgi:hypothetical protein
MRLVFLDFDGVLNSAEYMLSDRPTERERGGVMGLDPLAVARLNRLIKVTSAEVVVTSVVRHRKRRTELCDILKARGFVGTVRGMTPWHGGDHVRGLEIQAWLDEWTHALGPIEFVILDDDSDMNHLLPRLVKTSFATGLTDSDVDQAILMLT